MSMRFHVLVFYQAGLLEMVELMKGDPLALIVERAAAPVAWPPTPRSGSVVEEMRVQFALTAHALVNARFKSPGEDATVREALTRLWALAVADRAVAAGRAVAGWGDPVGHADLKREVRREILRDCIAQGITDHDELAHRLGVSRATYFRNWRPLLPDPCA